jgi:hypothetical protein
MTCWIRGGWLVAKRTRTTVAAATWPLPPASTVNTTEPAAPDGRAKATSPENSPPEPEPSVVKEPLPSWMSSP